MSKAIRTVKGWAELPTNVKSPETEKGGTPASTLMCRSAAETALYTCVTRMEGKTYSSECEGMELTVRVVTKVDWIRSTKKFGDFIRKAKTMSLIDTKLEDRITSCWERGSRLP